jgi:hypothetical protein
MIALVATATLLQGCMISRSISESVTAVSGSVSDSLKSSSDTITGGDARAEQEYRDDVRVATRTLVDTGASDDQFLRELGRIAELHGISHWEAEPGSLIALGAGACEAGLPEPGLDSLLARLGQAGEIERSLAHEGCRSAL